MSNIIDPVFSLIYIPFLLLRLCCKSCQYQLLFVYSSLQITDVNPRQQFDFKATFCVFAQFIERRRNTMVSYI